MITYTNIRLVTTTEKDLVDLMKEPHTVILGMASDTGDPTRLYVTLAKVKDIPGLYSSSPVYHMTHDEPCDLLYPHSTWAVETPKTPSYNTINCNGTDPINGGMPTQ